VVLSRTSWPALRLEGAQLLEYRFLYGSASDELCLVTNGPIDDLRARLLRAVGIEFVWVDDAGFHTSGSPLSSAVAALIEPAAKRSPT
jgi:hypothetical protein